MTFNQGPVQPATRHSAGARATWGAYWDALFPPAQVTAWTNFKLASTGVNVARRFWEQREYLRRTYESVYGSDPERWPSRHPGVVLDAVPSTGHAACLGCQWFDARGGQGSLLVARRHEYSDGTLP